MIIVKWVLLKSVTQCVMRGLIFLIKLKKGGNIKEYSIFKKIKNKELHLYKSKSYTSSFRVAMP